MMELEDLLAGNIPETLEEKTIAAGMFLRISKRIVPVSSLLLASARRDHFPFDTAGWVQWCRQNFEMEGSDRDHRRAIGELLLDTRGNHVVYNTLFSLSFDKLLSISRIQDKETGEADSRQIAAFLSHYNVKEMSREEVRDAVAQWLGETPKARNLHPDLPGFSAALSALNAMERDNIALRVADEKTATSALRAGIGLLGAGLKYHKDKGSALELLQNLKYELLNEVKELEAALACCIQHSETTKEEIA